jgi:hypothetical protein
MPDRVARPQIHTVSRWTRVPAESAAAASSGRVQHRLQNERLATPTEHGPPQRGQQGTVSPTRPTLGRVRKPIDYRGACPSRQRSAPIENPRVRIGGPVSFRTTVGYPDANDQLRGAASRWPRAAQTTQAARSPPAVRLLPAPGGVDHPADEPKRNVEAAALSARRTGTRKVATAVSRSLPDHLLARPRRRATNLKC